MAGSPCSAPSSLNRVGVAAFHLPGAPTLRTVGGSGGARYRSAMRVVVTGAAGFIGSHLRDVLAEEGDVVAVDSLTDYYEPARKLDNLGDAPLIEADLAVAPLEPLLDGADVVYHLAGQPGVRASFGPDFELYVRRNVLATGRLFEAAAVRGIRVVYASSSSVYGDAETYPTSEAVVPRPISPYGVTKLACEHLAHALARTAGLDAVGLRYFTVYGPRQRPDMAFARLLECLASGEPFPLYGDGSASRSFTYVADAVESTIAAASLGRSGEIYNVGGGEEATMSEAIALAEQIAGRPVAVERHGAASGDVRRTCADTSKAAEELGVRATTPLTEGLRAQWEWVAARVATR